MMQTNNTNEENVLTQRKSLSVRATGHVKALGSVQVRVLDLLEKDAIETDSRFQLSLDITNTSRNVTFDEIRIGINEVQSWASLIQPKHGNTTTMMEVTKLSRRCYTEWDVEHVVNEQTEKTERLVQLHGTSLEIPKCATKDREYGLLRIHHYLQVKLISHSKIVNNLRFRFPLVIGGVQYAADILPPVDHPLHAINKHTKRNPSKILAYGIARSVIFVTKTAERLFEKPAASFSRQSPAATVTTSTRPSLCRQEHNDGGSLETIVSSLDDC
mmetsp:Transcript_11319/g.18728  ORF Transcript_11319/g.18728 Transcript_11319/m.18728 type:complete len:272 (-) Transcript_11319:139-954(-)